MTKEKPRFYKSDKKPIWCTGCGDFTVLTSLAKALSKLELSREEVAVISGIGCSSRLPAYTSVYGFHGIHGRALPIATGLKVARPELTVLAASGDGDCFSIGTNHFIHTCRRNVDITLIVMDNHIYGMTKGQVSPTTEIGFADKLATHDSDLQPLQPLALALVSGASYIARAYSGEPEQLTDILVEAIKHPGFSFIHLLCQCITYCPEQKEWKKLVQPFAETTSDYAKANKMIEQDNGLQTGVVYNSARRVWPAATDPGTLQSLDELDKQFIK
ncbi:MAG: 2-oxoglutarate ferredoxin oxidoreductase subunit beta [Psychromonas sp.]|jgi:2-oxoglutarate ferredoxin oxidoreductase subunit beta|uniref:thiamine pyrophosphate-dependent enzyme n=1 Tax=Psychromonas sp. TaxID=1884585 RepID=UPI0039E3F6AA